jgi:peptidoglycan/xylan/chitin deacetylase (PgdA/CDA1 family)
VPPTIFRTWKLQGGVTPVNYLPDLCMYYRQRWSPDASPPGTVVAPIFFHSIRTSPGPMPDNVSIPEDQFLQYVEYARSQGFETITITQLIDFLTENARIPARSMILIVDDRRPGVLADNFLPVLIKRNWSVASAWPIGETTPEQWIEVQHIFESGHVEFEAHGWIHNIPISQGSSDAFIQHEVVDPIAVIQEHLGVRPLAFVWPGGGFARHAAEIARQAGYELGFTSNARGPLMFGWVPLGADEIKIGDPLMVLPRDWAPTWDAALRRAMAIADEARQFALTSYPAEAAWYRAACGGELPPAPAI